MYHTLLEWITLIWYRHARELLDRSSEETFMSLSPLRNDLRPSSVMKSDL